MMMQGTYEEVADRMRSASSILFITGAGISIESGLPTYRGIGGLYDGADTEEGVPIEVALSAHMLAINPNVTWKHLWDIALATRGAKPNRGHEIMAKWMRQKPESWILTQNVDGLHAQISDEHLIEVHGRADNLFCLDCGRVVSGESFLFGEGRFQAPDVPTCDECGGMMRPDVVLFGEFLSNKTQSLMAKMHEADVDLVMSIGTSSQFPYITFPVELAAARGVATIEINPEETAVSPYCSIQVRETCGEALTGIAERL